jgi:hypothetical protein
MSDTPMLGRGKQNCITGQRLSGVIFLTPQSIIKIIMLCYDIMMIYVLNYVGFN